MTTRPVFVSFYDYANLGDDLLVLTLAQRHPGTSFVYSADKSDGSAFAHLPNVRRVPRVRYIDGLLRRLHLPLQLNAAIRRRLIRRSAFAVRLGGSLYMETDGWEQNLARDAELLLNRHGAFFINGNFGPWRSPEFLAAYEHLFSQAVDVTVRDLSSRGQLAAVPNVRIAPDLLFSVSSPVPADGMRTGVVMSVVDLGGRADVAGLQGAYETAMAELVDDLVRHGRSVTLMSFCAIEGDEAAVGRILAAVPAPSRSSVSTHFYRGDIDAALTAIARAETVVATRFHAMVLGLAFGCKVRCVEYSSKLTQALDDLGLSDHGWSLDAFLHTDRESRLREVIDAGGELPEATAERARDHLTILARHLAVS